MEFPFHLANNWDSESPLGTAVPCGLLGPLKIRLGTIYHPLYVLLYFMFGFSIPLYSFSLALLYNFIFLTFPSLFSSSSLSSSIITSKSQNQCQNCHPERESDSSRSQQQLVLRSYSIPGILSLETVRPCLAGYLLVPTKNKQSGQNQRGTIKGDFQMLTETRQVCMLIGFPVSTS